MGIQRCKRKFKNRVSLTTYEAYKYKTWFVDRIKSIGCKTSTIEDCKQAIEVFFLENLPPPPKIELNVQLESEIHMVHIEGVLV